MEKRGALLPAFFMSCLFSKRPFACNDRLLTFKRRLSTFKRYALEPSVEVREPKFHPFEPKVEVPEPKRDTFYLNVRLSHFKPRLKNLKRHPFYLIVEVPKPKRHTFLLNVRLAHLEAGLRNLKAHTFLLEVDGFGLDGEGWEPRGGVLSLPIKM